MPGAKQAGLKGAVQAESRATKGVTKHAQSHTRDVAVRGVELAGGHCVLVHNLVALCSIFQLEVQKVSMVRRAHERTEP